MRSCQGALQRLRCSLSCQGGARAYSSAAAASDGPSSSGAREEPIFAACVLQRLPLVRPALPKDTKEFQAWERQRALQTGELKEYPEVAVARDDPGVKKAQEEMRAFVPVPTTTAADASGDVRSMRRALSESLYLVVRGGAAAGGSGGGKGGRGGGDGPGARQQGGWGFPQRLNQEGESISATAQQALYGAVGRAHPVLWVGNAPMAHLHAQPAGKVFFMLAQAVDDPWVTQLAPGSGADDFAWVTKQELLGSYLADARLKELVAKML